jgi:hypothetical protein
MFEASHDFTAVGRFGIHQYPQITQIPQIRKPDLATDSH